MYGEFTFISQLALPIAHPAPLEGTQHLHQETRPKIAIPSVPRRNADDVTVIEKLEVQAPHEGRSLAEDEEEHVGWLKFTKGQACGPAVAAAHIGERLGKRPPCDWECIQYNGRGRQMIARVETRMGIKPIKSSGRGRLGEREGKSDPKKVLLREPHVWAGEMVSGSYSSSTMGLR
ncbi:hypothetical protein BD779DRAFT_1476019 [Infundibulicybe gibba]|nr:hypothetical protein BD779DRAFT_1476019 [Infundibulicybe gibba]